MSPWKCHCYTWFIWSTFSPPRQLSKDLGFENSNKPKNRSGKGKNGKQKTPRSGGTKPSNRSTKASKGKPAKKTKTTRKGKKSDSTPAPSAEPESQPAGKKPRRLRKATAWAPMEDWHMLLKWCMHAWYLLISMDQIKFGNMNFVFLVVAFDGVYGWKMSGKPCHVKTRGSILYMSYGALG